MAMCCLPSC